MLLDRLRETTNADVRSEFSLALARLVGEEHNFIQLHRSVESEPGTVLSQAVTALRGKLLKSGVGGELVETVLDEAALALAQDDVDQGVDLLCAGLERLPADSLDGPCGAVIQECIARMGEYGMRRREYVILALHAFDCALPG